VLLLVLATKTIPRFFYVFCDVATQGVEFLEDQVHDAGLHGCLQTLEKSSPAADLFAIGLYHFGAGGIIHRCASVLLHLNLWFSTLRDVEAGRCSFLFTLRRFLVKRRNSFGENFSCSRPWLDDIRPKRSSEEDRSLQDTPEPTSRTYGPCDGQSNCASFSVASKPPTWN